MAKKLVKQLENIEEATTAEQVETTEEQAEEKTTEGVKQVEEDEAWETEVDTSGMEVVLDKYRKLVDPVKATNELEPSLELVPDEHKKVLLNWLGCCEKKGRLLVGSLLAISEIENGKTYYIVGDSRIAEVTGYSIRTFINDSVVIITLREVISMMLTCNINFMKVAFNRNVKAYNNYYTYLARIVKEFSDSKEFRRKFLNTTIKRIEATKNFSSEELEQFANKLGVLKNYLESGTIMADMNIEGLDTEDKLREAAKQIEDEHKDIMDLGKLSDAEDELLEIKFIGNVLK